VTIGGFDRYGLPAPTEAPLEKHPTVNSSLLGALRDGRIVVRTGIERLDGNRVRFTDGTAEEFDVIVMGTGFRASFPFLSSRIVDPDSPLYLRMMHPTIPSLYFVGLFQPIGCIWRLADYQARIAALQISGRLSRPADIDARIRHEVTRLPRRLGPSPRHAIEVEYHTFRRQLLGVLADSALPHGG
jgi:cation diffusion facilitator CzcD-associated flavoprotein CzcO